MEKDLAFLDPKLSLEKLSRIIGTNIVYLSKAINEGYGKPFPDVINLYRIEHLTKLLEKRDEEAANGQIRQGNNGKPVRERTMDLEDLALQSGFGSRSSFYQVFKEIKGMTPSKYFKRQKENKRH